MPIVRSCLSISQPSCLSTACVTVQTRSTGVLKVWATGSAAGATDAKTSTRSTASVASFIASSLSRSFHRGRPLQPAGSQREDGVGTLGRVRTMAHHDDGAAGTRAIAQGRQDRRAIGVIEIAGWLVREQEGWIVQ